MKDLSTIKKVLSEIKPELERRFHVSAIGVFGSYARGDQKPDSDIDIIVDFNRSVGVEFIDLADYIEGKLQSPVDLVSRKGIKHGYLELIEKDVAYV
jgi:predicted nucleotidyltransferase